MRRTVGWSAVRCGAGRHHDATLALDPQLQSRDEMNARLGAGRSRARGSSRAPTRRRRQAVLVVAPESSVHCPRCRSCQVAARFAFHHPHHWPQHPNGAHLPLSQVELPVNTCCSAHPASMRGLPPRSPPYARCICSALLRHLDRARKIPVAGRSSRSRGWRTAYSPGCRVYLETAHA